MKTSSAVLFLDVKGTFHHMIRQVLFGPDQALAPQLLESLGSIGCDLTELHTIVAHSSAEFVHDVPLADRRLLQDAHVHTWCRIAGSEDVFEATRGGCPGSPLADITYNTMLL